MPYTKVLSSGPYVEVYEYEKEPIDPRDHVRTKRKARTLESTWPLLDRRADNLLRLKRSFKRLVYANTSATSPPALLTLTMFEVLGVGASYSSLNVFFKRLRDFTGISFRYLAVLEFQRRGAVHFHVLIWDLPPALIDNERSNRILQNLWQRGYADCVPTDGSPKLAGYLAKYLSKSLHDKRLRSQKAFTASRNLLRPVLFKTSALFDDFSPLYVMPVDNSPLRDLHFPTDWLGKGRYRLFKN